MTPDYSRQIDIELLLSAPLVAAGKANAAMATAQTQLMLDFCFAKKNDATYEPVMINMVLTRSVIDDESNAPRQRKNSTVNENIHTVNMAFSVPLLCLMPLSSLAVNNVNLAFSMEILSATTSATSAPNTRILKERTIGRAQLMGKISNDNSGTSSGNDQTKSSVSGMLKVNIEASQLPLPTGVLQLIDLYSKSITPLPK